MSADERSHLEIQVAELRADVRHIQSDTTEIKAELRAITTELKGELRATNQRIDSLSESVNKRIDDLKDSLASAKIWAFGLYVALAGSLFYVLARGFKWI
jgi:peptidoglycan hydrolase CwlO-like protein